MDNQALEALIKPAPVAAEAGTGKDADLRRLQEQLSRRVAAAGEALQGALRYVGKVHALSGALAGVLE